MLNFLHFEKITFFASKVLYNGFIFAQCRLAAICLSGCVFIDKQQFIDMAACLHCVNGCTQIS